MKLNTYQNELISIVQSANGYFLTAYQICNILEKNFPQIWTELTAEYPSNPGDPEMGQGANKGYSPATYVAKALDYYRENGQPLRKEYFSCENVEFNGTVPGFTGNVVSIWAYIV